jgi:hypothetical protein
MLKNPFRKTWPLGLVYTIFNLKFSVSLINFISSFLSQRKFRVLVEKEIFTPRVMQAEVPQGSVLSLTPGAYLGLFASDTCIYAKFHREGYVLRKLQRGLSTPETWCERWNIKINEDSGHILLS